MRTFDDLRTEQAIEDPIVAMTVQLAGNLTAVRLKQRLTQRELGRLSGIPQKTISRIENAQDIPKLTTLNALATALGYNLQLTLIESSDSVLRNT